MGQSNFLNSIKFDLAGCLFGLLLTMAPLNAHSVEKLTDDVFYDLRINEKRISAENDEFDQIMERFPDEANLGFWDLLGGLDSFFDLIFDGDGFIKSAPLLGAVSVSQSPRNDHPMVWLDVMVNENKIHFDHQTRRLHYFVRSSIYRIHLDLEPLNKRNYKVRNFDILDCGTHSPFVEIDVSQITNRADVEARVRSRTSEIFKTMKSEEGRLEAMKNFTQTASNFGVDVTGTDAQDAQRQAQTYIHYRQFFGTETPTRVPNLRCTKNL
jgi:hypothetical protein